MEQINLKQNDKGYDIIFELTNNDDTALDLTSATSIKLHAVNVFDPTDTIDGTCAVLGTAPEGICKYTVVGTEFAKPTTYRAEIQVSFGANKILTLPEFSILVDAEIA
jgi:hypothetical protein